MAIKIGQKKSGARRKRSVLLKVGVAAAGLILLGFITRPLLWGGPDGEYLCTKVEGGAFSWPEVQMRIKDRGDELDVTLVKFFLPIPTFQMRRLERGHYRIVDGLSNLEIVVKNSSSFRFMQTDEGWRWEYDCTRK